MHLLPSWLVCGYTDEEIGGIDGMKIFIESEEFRRLNCGFALDEGITCLSSKVTLFNCEQVC